MSVVSAHKKQADGYAQEELLGWGELFAIVHLFPHVEIVVRSRIEFERDALDPMKHQVGAEHVRNVGKGPGRVALDAGDDAVEYFESHNEDYVNHPGT